MNTYYLYDVDQNNGDVSVVAVTAKGGAECFRYVKNYAPKCLEMNVVIAGNLRHDWPAHLAILHYQNMLLNLN